MSSPDTTDVCAKCGSTNVQDRCVSCSKPLCENCGLEEHGKVACDELCWLDYYRDLEEARIDAMISDRDVRAA